MNPRLMVESPDPYQSKKKFKLFFKKKTIFKENSFLSSRVRGRVIESGSGSGLEPRPLVRTENVDVD